MSVLDAIVQKKQERVSLAKSRVSVKELGARVREGDPPRDFREAIRRGKGPVRLITEIKKGSPSRGIIRRDFDPLAIARIYEERAVDAISVITEEDFFYGSLQTLAAVRSVVTRPVLRKDFIVDEYQIYEARAYGADAVLLIAALLEKNQSREYLHLSTELGLSVLFEIHDRNELETVLRAGADIIGINNRDLKTLSIDLNITGELAREIPPDKIVVSESGIRCRDDVVKIERYGVDAMLIGTVLMESPDIGRMISELRAESALINN